MERVSLWRKPRNANQLLLLVTALFLLCTAASRLLQLWLQDEDLLRVLAVHALLVEVTAIYLPCWLFLQRREAVAGSRITLGEVLWSFFMGMGLFLFFSGINVLWNWLLLQLNVPLAQSELPGDLGWRFAAAVVLVAGIPALCEEQLFRGILLENRGRADAHVRLDGSDRVWLRTALLSAALFALMHLKLTAAPIFFAIGLALAQIARLCRSAHAAMWAHGAYNLLALMFTIASQENGAEKVGEGLAFSATEILGSAGFYLLLGSVCLFGGWRMLKRCANNARERANLPANPGRWGEEALTRFREEPAPAPETDINGASRWALIAAFVLLAGANIAVLALG